MRLERVSKLVLMLVVMVAVAGSSGLGESARQDRATVWVRTFDQDFYNWADPHVETFQFPDRSMPWQQITMYYTIECPEAPADCDPWDRLGHLRVVTDDGMGGEIHNEIARIVTPYDITGGARPGSCTWEFDVTDYEFLLHDSVTLRNYIETWIGDDRGWLVTIDFAFTPGYTPYEPFQVVNLWTHDRLVYGDPADPIDAYLQPVDVAIDPLTAAAKVRAVVTGHGQGNTDNAAEFAAKLHDVTVGSELFSHYLWRDDCSDNLCSPQGGTWRYDRAGWCPGDKVWPWDLDVTAFAPAGANVTFDYEVQAYENLCRPTNPDCVSGVTCSDCNYNYTGHTEPNYNVNVQLILFRVRQGAPSLTPPMIVLACLALGALVGRRRGTTRQTGRAA